MVSNVAGGAGPRPGARARPAGRRPSRTAASPAGGRTRRRSSPRSREAGVEWVCLAGYMRLLSPDFVRAFPQRDPQHPPQPAAGLPRARRPARRRSPTASRSRAAPSTSSTRGSTAGRSSCSGRCRCSTATTRRRLAARILEQEHQAYPEALRRLLTEPWDVVGRRLVFLQASPSPGGRVGDGRGGSRG